MKRVEAINLMSQYGQIKEMNVKEMALESNISSLRDLRDCILGIGTILEENEKENYYIVSFASGIAGLNATIVVLQLGEGKVLIWAYSKEGIVKQNCTERTLHKLQDCLQKIE